MLTLSVGTEWFYVSTGSFDWDVDTRDEFAAT